MANSNSRKHARKVTLDAAVSNAIEKAVDMRKVAAFTVGAAGVIAGAAIAFGATPAMAADATSAAEPAKAPVTADEKAGKKAASKDNEAKEAETQDDAKKDQTDEKDQTNTNKEVGEQSAKKEDDNKADDHKQDESGKAPAGSTTADAEGSASADANKQGAANENGGNVRHRGKRSVHDDPSANDTATVQDRSVSNYQDREANQEPSVSNQINISKDQKDSVPNMYAWGSSDNVYVEDIQKNSVTFTIAKPDDGSTITNVAIFPSDTNGVDNKKSRKFLEYYSDPNAKDEHQSYSGIYEFKVNPDGTATLTMNQLYTKGTVTGGASAYSANRCIYVYGEKDGKTVVLYKTNIARAATLVPPKTAGSIVLKYNEELTDKQIKDKLKAALDAPTEAPDKKSVSEQIVAASKSKGVGGRTGTNGAFVQTPDDPEKKVIINDQQAYDAGQLAKINQVTSKDGQPTTYVAGAQTLKTYLISDLGYKSEALALTVARYDTRIDKPIVDEVDIAKLTDDQKADICKKLAQLNHVTQDKVKFNDQGQAVISFDGVDEKDAPKIELKDLVLKQLKEEDVIVPTGEKAVFVYNPLGYSNAELDRIKQSILDANKDNEKLGLTRKDQISLSYLTGNLTASGTGNQGISNGRQENTITVKIKTDKAVAEFTSDVTKSKLTKFVNIREDYTVSWTKDKIDGRKSDEGLSWSEDHKTIIYRYDPTKAVAFKSSDITKLLTATPKAGKAGLRVLNGDEHIDHEGEPGKEKKSHVYYVIDSNGEPTGALTLGIMNSGYWTGDPQITGTEVDRGNVLSKTGEYKWDDDAKPVTLASKDGKIYRARLFVAPYGMESYQYVYTHPDGKNPNNTTKAINVIFVPQTNHKTKDLKDSIGEHKLADDKKTPTDSKYYNASKDKKDAYDEALKEANAALEAAGNTEDSKLSEALKARIDNATINLNKAREALDGAKTDKEKLKASIDENGKAAEGNNPATLTQATNQFKNVSDPDFKDANGNPDTKKNEDAKAAKKAYDEALQAAEAARDDENATQKAVDDAKAKLDEARKKLNDFTTNKDELNNAIAQHGKAKYVEDAQGAQTLAPAYQNATDDERKAYDEAVKKANELAQDPNASQKEVNEAIKKLKEAKAALDKNATDKAPLDAAVQNSFDNPDPDNANGKKSVFYTNAAAKKDSDANAKKAVEDYDKALKKAKDVLADKNATKKDVEDAKKALEDAEKALHAEAYQTKTTDLAEAIADNVSGYLMPAYFNAFDLSQSKDPADVEKAKQAAKDFKAYNDAYHAAKDLLKEIKKPNSTVTQEQADKIKKQLLDARKTIDKYATDTSKISAALLHSLAITKSPAYLNASAGAEGSEEAKAKKAYDDALKALQDAFNDKMPQDTVDGKPDSDPISTNNIPAKDGDTSSPDYLKSIQSHAKGQPLNRDVTKLLAKLNDAVKGLDKFKTKTDELIESINKDSDTHPSPAFKNASLPNYQKADGSGADDAKNTAAKAAADAYGLALNTAKDLLKDPNATQAQIDEAKKNLDKARTELDKYNTDVAKLKESVKKHGTEAGVPSPEEGTLTSDAYRNASDPHFLTADGKPDEDKNKKAAADKKAYDEALTKAQELLKKHDSDDTPQDAKPTQADIDAALKALDTARKKLEDNYKTVTTDLENEIKKSTPEHAPAATGDEFENTPEFKNADAKKDGTNDNADVKAYKEALKKARELVQAANPIDPTAKNSSHPTQKQINDALEALKQAKQAITDGYKTDVDKLKQAKEYAEDVFKKTPEYKNATAIKNDNNNAKHEQAGKDLDGTDQKPGLSKLIEKIATKLQDTSKMTQTEVDALVKQLVTAQKKITENYKTDVKLLSNEVGDKDAQGQDVIPPFEASVTYKNALAKSNAGDATATEKLKAYADKLQAAQDLINKVNNPDPNAEADKQPTQKQVDDALEALKKAKQDIDDNFKTNAADLKKEAEDKDATGQENNPKFEDSPEYKNALAKKGDGQEDIPDVKEYQAALKKAKDLLKKFSDDGSAPKQGEKDIPTQQEVDDALQTLKEIKEKILANYKTSPVDLQKEVDLSKDGDDDKRDGLFENTPAFKNATAKGDEASKKALEDYNTKLQAAKEMLEKFDRATGKPKAGATGVPTQAKLDEALKALQDAKKKIEDNYSTVKYDLRQEAGDDFTKSPEYQNAQAKGDDESKQALDEYKNALDDANSVLNDPNATQAEVDAALKRLQDAKAKLKAGNSTDKSKLQTEADDDANFRKSPYFIIGNKADIEAYEDALAEAKSVLNDPNATQAQVDAALKKLEDAKKRILDFLSHFGGSGNGTGDWNGYGFANGHESYGALVDKAALQIEVNNAVDANANTAQAVAYRQALAEAKSVLNNPNATQAQVDAALRKLQAAKAALLNSLSGASGHKIAKTGAATGLFAGFAVIFAGLGVAGVASRRRKHSKE